MAAQPVGEANQQLWDETLTRLLNLSAATVRRNTDLESRVAELEVELLVWKQAHSVALEASERENKAHNVQMAALNRQISGLDPVKSQNQNPLILCIIHGDELVFNREFLTEGYHGGRAAAQQLTKAIAEHLSNEDVHLYGRLSFWITVYLNKRNLSETLLLNNVCSEEQFESFLTGFGHASPRFSVIDVGFGAESSESKIKEYLQTFIYFPQTLRVFFGGYDVSYMATFSALEKDQILGKLVLIDANPQTGLGDQFQIHAIPRLCVDSLFMFERLPKISRILTPLTMASFNSAASNGGLISPQSPDRVLGRVIDPSLPLHKQNPPPCNEHYLMTCSKGAGMCKYSHDYILTSEQLVSLANNAKKAPCNWLKNGVQCPYGEKCCWGHVCPNGPKCFHLSKGKCWFKGEAMHPDSS
ncbi:uncharacterized protein LACBIDRAFT_311971 [Laccaria bicolor S238N-H82]|uniref:Predicted protein n=1 Tax=Laccaria bicolor (strain S238N-H82 / ATCC MYA-4686) TaxID=486041 RepID=B0CYR8_LACBS|nr:uncharacterized protein LACBIDRAFT_311971 [Laccaria bicolor S238N-H82]EDR12929.1 predicted protein [Laccaria bicolor S238N-H82]|eukprot:XP_001877193.1 predicted protein [Laccaria bicolor S238N-H82]